MQLIVLGMHRSGTSVLARTLNLMGAYFGPEGMSTGANKENPTGFWERKDVRALNDAVLHAVGCDWDRILEFDVNALPSAVIDDFDMRASRLVREIDAHRPWLLKEPRLCLVFPLWRKFLDLPICIHIVRNPLEVAASLYTRNKIPVDAGMVLWEHYVRSAVAGSTGAPMIFVSHRRLMTRPAETIRKLFDDLIQRDVRGLRMPAEREIDALVRNDLYRERESDGALQAHACRSQVTLFARLQDGDLAASVEEVEPGDSTPLTRYEASLAPLQPPAPASGRTLTEAQLREKVSIRDKQIELHRQAAGKFEATIKQQDERIAVMATDLETAQSSLKQRTAQSATELDKAKAMLEARSRQFDEATQGLVGTGLRLEAQSRKTEQLADELAKTGHLLDAQSRETEKVTYELAKTGLRLEAQLRETEKATHTRVNAEQTAELRLRDLARLTRAMHGRDSKISELAQRLHERQEHLRKSKNKLANARLDLARLEKSLDAAVRKFAAAQRSRRERDAKTAKLKASKRKLVKQLAQSNESIAAAREAHSQLVLSTQTPTVHRGGLRQLVGAPWRVMAGRLARRLGASPAADNHRVAQSGLFNRDWYLAAYPDVAASGIDPVLHYLSHGWREGRNPSSAFDTRAYLESNDDVARSGINPLLHYITHGQGEGRNPW